MGFETCNSHTARRVRQDYKTVPMGFETNNGNQGGVYPDIIIRQSLWDLKLEHLGVADTLSEL